MASCPMDDPRALGMRGGSGAMSALSPGVSRSVTCGVRVFHVEHFEEK